jgi:hypothetical protein
MLKPRFFLDRYLTTAGWMCLIVVASAFAVALVGAILNPFIGNWFESSGLALVGLLYLAFLLTTFAPGGTRFLGTSEILSPRHENDPAAPTPATRPSRRAAGREKARQEHL